MISPFLRPPHLCPSFNPLACITLPPPPFSIGLDPPLDLAPSCLWNVKPWKSSQRGFRRNAFRPSGNHRGKDWTRSRCTFLSSYGIMSEERDIFNPLFSLSFFFYSFSLLSFFFFHIRISSTQPGSRKLNILSRLSCSADSTYYFHEKGGGGGEGIIPWTAIHFLIARAPVTGSRR